MSRQLWKSCLAAVAFLVIPLASAPAQSYDTLEILRLPERTIYIFPKGYAPAIGAYAPVVNPWFVQPGFAAPAFATSNVFPRDAVMPTSYYGAMDVAASTPSAASIALRVPENAEVWIQGKKMDEKGTERRVNLPAQDPLLLRDYEIRVEWPENGGKFSKTTHLTIRPGDQPSITYVAALAGKKSSAPESPMPRETEWPSR
jgi:uncharacterized protein (TIGR03000 family)